MLSILTPAFNEAENLETLHRRIVGALDQLGDAWEWLIVDDHSRDRTFAVIERLAERDPRVRGIRLARNSGSHVAITCALHHVAGDAAVIIAADLQDPPETVAAMLAAWRGGAHIVWAVRRERPGDRGHAGFAAIYYWIMRHVVGMKEMPARGADFFLIDRVVIRAVRRFSERNLSILALITWLGFRQASIEYDKQPRAAGASGWTLARKITLVVDSVTAFSEFPIRLCSYAGAALLVLGAILGGWALFLLPTAGMGALFLLAAMVGLTGVQLLALGVVGEYVWRALEQSRRRPAYLIEATVGPPLLADPDDVRDAVAYPPR
jgi:dolichol-phosphate mannosyltransferase